MRKKERTEPFSKGLSIKSWADEERDRMINTEKRWQESQIKDKYMSMYVDMSDRDRGRETCLHREASEEKGN